MRILVSPLRMIILLGSVSIALNSVFAQDQTTSPPPPAPQPQIVSAPEIIVDRKTGKGTATLTLRGSDTTKEMELSLTGVVNTTTGIKPAITFKDPVSGKEGRVLSVSIKPNQVADVLVMAADVAEDGDFEVELRNKEALFGKMKIIRLPFSVALDGPNPNEADLSMVAQSPTTLTLKNNDPVAYPLFWRLTINGHEVCGDKLTLAAKGLGVIQCRPSVPFSPGKIQDLFKVDSSKGHHLSLYPEKDGWFDNSSPWKRIPVNAKLSYFGQGTQQFWGYIIILAALIAGGITSLILSQALPNRLKRLNIKERLMDLGRTTSNLSSKVGSRLQVLLRLERGRLFDLLESRNTFSPDFAGIVTRCKEGADKLEGRVVLVQQIDVVLERLEQRLTLGPPPSQVAEIEALIDDAKVLLVKAQPTDKDLEAARKAITEAENKVDKLNREDLTFGEALAKRALEVQQGIKAMASSPTFTRIAKTLPGPPAVVQAIPAGTTRIPPAGYTAVDMAVEKMFLIQDYVVLMDGTVDKDILNRLLAREDKLLDLLQLQSWPAMRSARLLLREMKGDVYPERIQEKLIAGTATISMEPLVAYDKARLEFCVNFHSKEIDEAAAKEEWKCEWAFGDGLTEKGWNVSHYFLLAQPRGIKSAIAKDFHVQATFRDVNGDTLLDPKTNEPVTIKKTVHVQPTRQEGFFGDRARTELLKLMAALLIAVFALVAGAREQLLKLDILPGLVAVFMVGFGADTIKNLLTKSESTQ